MRLPARRRWSRKTRHCECRETWQRPLRKKTSGKEKQSMNELPLGRRCHNVIFSRHLFWFRGRGTGGQGVVVVVVVKMEECLGVSGRPVLRMECNLDK